MDIVLQYIAEIGKVITPVGITAGGVGLIAKAIMNHFAKKKETAKWNKLIDLLEKLVDKNTCEEDVKVLSEEVEKLGGSIKELRDSIKNDESVTHDQTATLGQMIGVIFENSTLPVETKERLRTLKTKIEYASDASVVENLIVENSKLQKKVKVLDSELQKIKEESQPVTDVDTDVVKPEITSHIVIQ